MRSSDVTILYNCICTIPASLVDGYEWTRDHETVEEAAAVDPPKIPVRKEKRNPSLAFLGIGKRRISNSDDVGSQARNDRGESATNNGAATPERPGRQRREDD